MPISQRRCYKTTRHVSSLDSVAPCNFKSRGTNKDHCLKQSKAESPTNGVTNYITFAYSNVKSVRNKISELALLIDSLRIDIFVVVESWLTEKDSVFLPTSIIM